MKKIKYIFASLLVAFALNTFAQDGPPEPPQEHGETTDQEPGNRAPISGGVFILLGLGAAYGAKRVYDLRKEEE